MARNLSTVYCPICGELLFRSFSFLGVIEIVCNKCHKTVRWSLTSNHEIILNKSLRNALAMNAPEIAFAIFKEVNLWRNLVTRKIKKGEPLTFTFEYKYLPEEVVKVISEGLSNISNFEDVDLVFWSGIEYFLKK